MVIVSVNGVVSAMLAPEVGAEKVTCPPSTGSWGLALLVRLTSSGLANAVLTSVLWLSPTDFVSVNPCDSNAPTSHALPCGRVTPRWSVVGALLQPGMASMAGEPGSSA